MQPSLARRRRPGGLSIPARYASIQRVPTGIRAVSDPQLVGHRLAMELFENPRGGYPGGFERSHPSVGAPRQIRTASYGGKRAMTDRRHTAGVVAFLENVLADHGLCVPELEVMARAAGLLGQRQSITHAKVFKTAKKFLGIKSVRNGFGDRGEWLWQLERQPASPVSKPLAQPPLSIEDTYAEALEEVPADVRARRIPSSWIDGVARLDHHRP